MRKNYIFHRMPSASVRARVIRHFRSVISRAMALVMMAVMALPSMFGTARVTPSGVNTSGTASSLVTPEPFQVSKTNVAPTMIGSFASSVTTKVMDIVTPPKLPPGFESGKVPTFTDRVVSSLATLTATKSAIRNPKSAIPAPPPSGTVLFDFDEDGKSDIGRWQGGNTEFKVRNSSNGSYTTATIGSSSSVAAPGDFDGDGQTDAAVFAAGAWTIKKSSDGSTQTVSFGTTGDKPVAADYDGDATTDIAVFRPSTGTWWIRKSSDLSTVSTAFGASSDIPVTGNWDGDAYADIAVYRPSTGYWYVTRSTAGSLAVGWGAAGDIPVPADFDGDNKTDLAVYRPSTGAWWIMKSSTGFDGTHVSHTWGNYGDQPVPADYDGDGEADLAVWRPKTGVWYIAKSSEDNEEFEYHSLGIAGNTAVPSAYLSQVGTTVYGDDMANARLSPKNATGGTNLYSRNFSWGTSLVGLPGRSGLDAGFGISYNSLIWTKLGTEMHFDVDQSNVSPGFRIGFPTIEPVYYNDVTLKHSFLMVTPSGARVEFRNTTVSNTYETADSSYTQLKIKSGQSITTPIEEIDLEVTTTDGTMMTYEWLAGAYRCSQIKDRNGNYITIVHDEEGTLRTVTDTLGRVVTVNYDSQLYPTSITQTWKDTNGSGSNVTHTWASFTYTTKTVATNFGSLTVVGPPNDTVMKVLEKVTYADGSYAKFTHNGYVQVEKVENFAADDHLLNHVRTDLDGVSGTQSDCPRFGATYTKVDNFNLSSGVPQEIEVTNTITTGQTYSLPDSISGSATRIDVTMTGHPDGLYSRTYVGASGWEEGLPMATEDCIGTNCSDRKRWSWTDWDQDNPEAGYILNPRVEETRIGDGTNTKRSKTEYWMQEGEGNNASAYGLPMNQYVLGGTSLTTILKAQTFTYDMDTAYTSRRIIGLPETVTSYGGSIDSSNLVSKVSFEYDEGSFSDSGLQQNISPVQHDNTNYGSSFVTGRGNLTATTRWNVDYPTSSTYAITSSTKYNTAGSPVARITPGDGINTRTTRIGYADNFNSTVGVATYAYPTVLTDPAGASLGDASHSSTGKYRYDIGANVEANSPAPAGNTYGKRTKRLYDSTGRLERTSVYINTTEHAYTRYEYPTSGIQSKVYSTIIDTDNDGADTDDELLSETFTDGAGRVRLSRVPHTFNTNGTTATWAGTITEYDILGRVRRQSVPTEVNSSWAAAGDDATRGFLYTHQKYDWMGRVVRKINTDGIDQTSLNDSDVLISYEGCGCAGGVVTTVEGELVPRTDTTGNARRKQKTYEDILGRTIKMETFAWDGSTVYSTVVNSYNGRDQVTLSRQYAGTPSSSMYQDTTASFEGHGRLASSHKPEQRDGSTLKYTTYTYSPDDSVATMTDGRNVITSYTYNSRGLVTDIGWDPNGSGVTDSADVGFAYDNLGNRTNMTDGLGEVDYEYNSLSQLTAEVRDFTDTLADAPNGVFRLEYTYQIGGQLKSYNDPYGEQISYTHDKKARLNTVSGSSFASVTDYASNPHYRAWGAVESVEYGSGMETYATYDNSLRVTNHEVRSIATPANKLFDKDYEYYSDGRLKMVDEKVGENQFDRSFKYEHQGRVLEAKSGVEAHGDTVTNLENLPYRQTYSFNAFGNITNRQSTLWNYEDGWNCNYSVTNNRVTNSGYIYDHDGRTTQSYLPSTTYKYDASGSMIETKRTLEYETEISRDGNGREAKRSQRVFDGTQWGSWVTSYLIFSSVLGRIITVTQTAGAKKETYVVAGGAEIAKQQFGTLEYVEWLYKDASGLSAWGGADDREELDGLGNNVGTEGQVDPPETGQNAASPFNRVNFGANTGDCELEGVLMPCACVTECVKRWN